MTEHVISICAGCRDDQNAAEGAKLVQLLRDRVAKDVVVRSVDCMTICSDPISVGMRAEGKAVYLFSGVTLSDADDLAAMVRLYLEAPDGWVEDARPAGRIRFCLKGRVPA